MYADDRGFAPENKTRASIYLHERVAPGEHLPKKHVVVLVETY